MTQYRVMKIWVDPPSGWLYGFPKVYDPSVDGDCTEWMIKNGYPAELAAQRLPVRMWSYSAEDEHTS